MPARSKVSGSVVAGFPSPANPNYPVIRLRSGQELDFYTKTLGLRVIAERYRAARDSYKADLGT